ncbi:MAG: nucleotide exchange factor GrpE [Planctomycetes bacterium]|nr:nucleotide exchange factor GrpE [Planctomycetota bacterium]
MVRDDRTTEENAMEDSTGAVGEVSENEDVLSSVVRERDELKDKLLRTHAESLNVAKRMRAEHANSMRHASRDFAKAMLPILDGLERTIQSIDESGRDDPIATGVKLLREEFLKSLRVNGVEPIESVGKSFDPELHEALMQDPKSEQPAGTVTTEFERGYTLHDRVLRHAKVVVSAKAPDPIDELPGETQGT